MLLLNAIRLQIELKQENTCYKHGITYLSHVDDILICVSRDSLTD